MVLTKQGIDKAIPHTASWPNEPFPLCAGRKAKRGAHDAHHQVTHRNVYQQPVNGRTQHFIPAEKYQDQKIVQEAQSPNDAKADGCNQVASGTQSMLLPISARRTIATAAAAPGTVISTAATGTEHLSQALSRSPPAKYCKTNGGCYRNTHKTLKKPPVCYFFLFFFNVMV